jgi:hypothetical protein
MLLTRIPFQTQHANDFSPGVPDQATALRALAASVKQIDGAPLLGEVVFSFSHLGYYVEIVERPRTSFQRFSAYITEPGKPRRKCDVGFHLRKNAAEDAMAEVNRLVQDKANAAPQFLMPPSSSDFEAARQEAERVEWDRTNTMDRFD